MATTKNRQRRQCRMARHIACDSVKSSDAPSRANPKTSETAHMFSPHLTLQMQKSKLNTSSATCVFDCAHSNDPPCFMKSNWCKVHETVHGYLWRVFRDERKQPQNNVTFLEAIYAKVKMLRNKKHADTRWKNTAAAPPWELTKHIPPSKARLMA